MINTATSIQERSPTLLTAFAPLLLALFVGDVSAAEEALECRLYMGRATEITDRVEPTFSPVSLATLRRSAVCVFTDGRIAEKQFVEISAERDAARLTSRRDGRVPTKYSISTASSTASDLWKFMFNNRGSST